MEIPGYTIQGEIGRGGMATVYLAVQNSLNRIVALKVLSGTLVANPRFCKRFLKEGNIVAQLSHPHIVTIYDIGHSGSEYFMSMECLKGGNLKGRIRRGIAPDEAIRTVLQIADALGYAHDRGFLHRDVKPQNILFRENGEAVLSDFGIAKSLDDSSELTGIGKMLGSPRYMSPEQIAGANPDGRSDLYSLGIVIYSMLTGKPPYAAENAVDTARMHLVRPIPQLPPATAHYQPVLNRLLAKSPDNRYANAAQLIEHLRDIEGGEVTATIEEAIKETTKERIKAPKLDHPVRIRLPVPEASHRDTSDDRLPQRLVAKHSDQGNNRPPPDNAPAKKRSSTVGAILAWGIGLIALALVIIPSFISETHHGDQETPLNSAQPLSPSIAPETHPDTETTKPVPLFTEPATEQVDIQVAAEAAPTVPEPVTESPSPAPVGHQDEQPDVPGQAAASLPVAPAPEALPEDAGIENADNRYVISNKLESLLREQAQWVSRMEDGSLQLSIDQHELFYPEEGELTGDSREVLGRLAYYFRNFSGFTVAVSDRSGVDVEISRQRANNIKTWLMAQGLSPKRIRTHHALSGNATNPTGDILLLLKPSL